MKKLELRQLIKEEIQNELKDKFNKAINSTYENFILSIGAEYEEIFSRKLFNLFEKYKEQFGKKHPLEFEWGKKSSLNELSESQKLNTQQEMNQLLEDGKIRLKKIQQSMKSKGYEI